ncbi:unnamed protein product, partial [Symbiodinium sp. CCMP2592]
MACHSQANSGCYNVRRSPASGSQALGIAHAAATVVVRADIGTHILGDVTGNGSNTDMAFPDAAPVEGNIADSQSVQHTAGASSCSITATVDGGPGEAVTMEVT